MKKTRSKRKFCVGIVCMLLFSTLGNMSAGMEQVHAESMESGWVSLPHLHAGNSNDEGGCYTVPVYHNHTGNSGTGDGCYTVSVPCGGSISAKTGESYCGNMNVWSGPSEHYEGNKWWAQCNSCGALFGPHDVNNFGAHHMRTETYYSCDRCGMRYSGGGTCTKTVGYTTGCGKDGVIESYETGCGYHTCGSMRIIQEDTAFAREATLVSEVLTEEAGCSITGYTWSNGNAGAAVTVTENGTYTCAVTYKDNCSGEIGSAEVSISVNNIDRQGPSIFAEQSTTEWTNEPVKLTATAQDDQSGLHENAYSWNGGEWQSATEYTVTGNGTHILKVRDRLGNESEHVFTVSNIDCQGPSISAEQSTTEWTNEPVKLTATAQDDQSGLHENAYSWNGGEWQSATEYTVTGNGTHILKVRDRLGNESEHVFTVSNIDCQGPSVSIGQSTTEWTNESVKLTATAQDDQSGLHESAYSWNGGEWQSMEEYPVTENGTYTLKVRDQTGNESECVLTISNIDKKFPVIKSWELSTVELTSGPVEVTVTATDEESGLAEQAYSLDGKNWQEENVFTIRENGIYNIYVRDKAGNMVSLADTEEVITISNIRLPEPERQDPETPTPVPLPTPLPPVKTDTKEPSVQLTLAIESWTEGTNKILVSAQDEQLAKEPYSYDGGATWTDVAEYDISESGIYVVLVRDAAGNVAVSTIEAIKLVTVTEQPETDENMPVFFTLSMEEEAEPEKPQVDMGVTWQMLQEQPTESDIWRPEAAQPVVQIEESETPLIDTYRQDRMDLDKIVAVIAGTVAGGGIFMIFIFYFGTWVPIYAQIASGAYKRVGRARLQRKKETYQIRMSRIILDRAETNQFKVKLGKQFAKKHSSELLRIFGNETHIDRKVDENVMFQM